MVTVWPDKADGYAIIARKITPKFWLGGNTLRRPIAMVGRLFVKGCRLDLSDWRSDEKREFNAE